MQWYLHRNVFYPDSDYDHLKQIVRLMGVPDDDVITQSQHGTDYFVQWRSKWKLMELWDYRALKGELPQLNKRSLKAAKNLEDLIKNYYEIESGLEFEERRTFLDLITKMFHLNPEKRITPAEALRHPFITSSHFNDSLSYIVESNNLMSFTPTLRSDPNRNKEPQQRFSSTNTSESSESTSTGTSSDLNSDDSLRKEDSQNNTSNSSSDSEISDVHTNENAESEQKESFPELKRGLENQESPPELSARPENEEDQVSSAEMCSGRDDQVSSAEMSSGLKDQVRSAELSSGRDDQVSSAELSSGPEDQVSSAELSSGRDDQRELSMLEAIRTLDPEQNNIVHFYKYFQPVPGVHCMEFEGLDMSVRDLMIKQKAPFSLREIRTMTRELLIALNGLQTLGVMHTDIKPDNIMLVEHKKQPFKLKLIDFGLARFKQNTSIGTIMQPPSFRAPEVTLGLSLTEAVDMWSLGCCLMQQYLFTNILKPDSDYDHLRQIVHFMGVPDDDVITREKDHSGSST
ncbi:hypothetical protein WMY93_021447 [Mugilogobius chulae]|uniref:Protein kinase domain-containing protein n=1 Tax=Mugilogobius chulae TaxID=88201 RepID=A0AAW0NAN6_9GOBI